MNRIRLKNCLPVAFAAVALAAPGRAPADEKDRAASRAIERGLYMVNAAACSDCHTPLKMGPNGPEPDLARGLSGHPQDLAMPPAPKLAEGPWLWIGAATNTAFAGPWGVSYSANITPDTQTGIGKWRERDFISAIRSGKHLGTGRPILPPMPAPAYANLSNGDLKAIFAYLMSRPPVKNKVPEYQPPAK